jgi:hypothetical protein
MRRNSVNWEGDESMAAIRAGQGLLVGPLRCGRCGRKLHVRYWGGRGTEVAVIDILVIVVLDLHGDQDRPVFR